MVNWKRVGLIASIGTLLYAGWCASPVGSEARINRANKPVFLSGHYESSDSGEEGLPSFLGVRERIYNDSVLFDIWQDLRENASIYYSSPPVRLRERPLAMEGAPAAVEVHYHGKDIGCLVQYSTQGKFAGQSRRLASFVDDALHGNLVRVQAPEEILSSYSLNYARCPAVIVSCGNIATEKGHEWASDDDARRRVSKAIVEGVDAFVSRQR